MTTTSKLPRGLRNCNPGNIRHSSDHFQGEINGSDKSFKTFRSMPYGYRALLRVVTTYITKYGCSTVRTIISRWAPPNENNTEAYISFVCDRIELTDTDVISHTDKSIMCSLAAAISHKENGIPANLVEVEQGWELM